MGVLAGRRRCALAQLRAAALLGAFALAGCSEPSEPRPGDASPAPSEARAARTGAPGASWDYVRAIVEILNRPAHASDGGGRAWLELGPDQSAVVRSDEPRAYHVVYEAGEAGIAPGGSIVFEVVPNGGWTAPQLRKPEEPGFTTVTRAGGKPLLGARVQEPQSLLIPVGPRGLAPGARVHIRFGAGAAGAVARIAEHTARFHLAVDGDGDGGRSYLSEPVRLSVTPGPAVAFTLRLPPTAEPGDEVTLRGVALDRYGNHVDDFSGDVSIRVASGDLRIPKKLFVRPGDRGRGELRGVAAGPGVVRLRADAAGGIRGFSNPLDVREDAPTLLWGDLHGHSSYSDGAGSPEEFLRYARDVAHLDVVALTDHDYWGPIRLDQRPERWAEIQAETLRFHEPGRFVTLLGFEWTSWIHGHRHVLYFRDSGEIFSAIDPRYDTPRRLWDALEGEPALTFAHHSAGGPIATNWGFAPDPVLEPLTEVASVHGSSEAPDAPRIVRDAVPGNFVRDALDRGYRLGFLGSGDSHGGHPGSPLGLPQGGLAGIWSDRRTREGVLEAMRARRIYATNGPRILLEATLSGRPMGASVPSPARREELRARIVAERNLERVDVVRSGRVVETAFIPRKTAFFELAYTLEDLRAGEYVYVRAVQRNGGAAWSSPFFVDP